MRCLITRKLFFSGFHWSALQVCVFLSQVCLHYNKGSGPHGCCTFQEKCTKVHLCQHFVQGACMFGLKCKRQHAIDQHGRRMLEERGLSGDVIEELPFIYRNIHHLTVAAASTGDKDSPVDVVFQALKQWAAGVDESSCVCVSSEKIPDSLCERVGQSDDRNICLHFIRNSCRFQSEFTFICSSLTDELLWYNNIILILVY